MREFEQSICESTIMKTSLELTATRKCSTHVTSHRVVDFKDALSPSLFSSAVGAQENVQSVDPREVLSGNFSETKKRRRVTVLLLSPHDLNHVVLPGL